MGCHKFQLEWLTQIIHPCGCIYFINNNLYETCYYFSTFYYIADSVSILINMDMKNSKTSIGFLIHHAVSLHLLSKHVNSTLQSIVFDAYLILEYSNIFLGVYSFIVYTFKKETIVYKLYALVETIGYSYFRIICFGIEYKNNIMKVETIDLIFISLLYFLGIFWSFKLLKISLSNFKKQDVIIANKEL